MIERFGEKKGGIEEIGFRVSFGQNSSLKGGAGLWAQVPDPNRLKEGAVSRQLAQQTTGRGQWLVISTC